MRKLEDQMINCIRNRKPFTKGNTRIVHDGAKTRVHLYNTQIAELDFDNQTLKLHAGNWLTATTKSRLNAITQTFANAYVGQNDFTWYVYRYDTNDRLPFEDGMILEIK